MDRGRQAGKRLAGRASVPHPAVAANRGGFPLLLVPAAVGLLLQVCYPSVSNARVNSPGVPAADAFNQGAPGAPTELGPSVRLDPSGTISWDAEPDAADYDVYRGSLPPSAPWTYTDACLLVNLPATGAEDRLLPGPGGLLFYLVSKVNTRGEGPLGTDSLGNPRPNPTPCSDLDGDSVPDNLDNCPVDPNPDQANNDGDSAGDICDPDDDDDGLLDIDEALYGTDSFDPDTDHDGLGDGVEVHFWGSDPFSAQSDTDGIPDGADNCPAVANPLQEETDGDGVGDACDNCIDVPNAAQVNTDGDGVGDACEVTCQLVVLTGGGYAQGGSYFLGRSSVNGFAKGTVVGLQNTIELGLVRAVP